MASTQYAFGHEGMEIIINNELIMSFLDEEEPPVENHSSISKEEEEKLNRVIRSLEVEINMSSPTTIETQKMDPQQTDESGLADDFGWLNDFDHAGMITSQNDDEMMNWCTELSYMDGVVDSTDLEVEGGDYYAHNNNYGLTFEEPTLSLWQENSDLVMY